MTGQSQPSERTPMARGLVGFNISWVLAGLSAAVAACGYLWFDSVAALIAGSVLAVVSLVACIRFLRLARQE